MPNFGHVLHPAQNPNQDLLNLQSQLGSQQFAQNGIALQNQQFNQLNALNMLP